MRSVRGREQFLEVMATGALTPLLLPLSWLVRRAVPLEDAELAIGFVAFHAAHVLNDPHFAVTYLLFYEDAAESARSLPPSSMAGSGAWRCCSSTDVRPWRCGAGSSAAARVRRCS
jgi:hypothetical protein